MKKTKYLIGTCLAFLLAGCSDEMEIPADRLPVSGDEIEFGAYTGQFAEAKTKTVYEEPDDYANYTSLSINWQADQDQVRVYSPEASTECQSADYTVRQDAATQSYYLQKNGEIGVRWGNTSQNHNFYAFYPLTVEGVTGSGASISGLETSTTVSAVIPTAQEHGTVTTRTNNGETWKIVTPNMSYAMMAGKGTWTAGTDKNVSLEFTPIVTVLDVVVNGPTRQEGVETGYNVLGVSVRSKTQAIVGSFTYDVNTGAFNYTSPASDDNNLAYVDCMDKGEPTHLNPGEKLNVKFFLLPRTINSSELTVSVLLESGQTLTQALEPNGTEGVNLVSGNIVKVRTPNLNPAATSNWQSMIDDDVLFASQLSMPGTKNSYSYLQYNNERYTYDANTDIMQTYQTLDIGEQFDAGVRAFDIKVNTENNHEGAIYVGTDDTNQTLQGMLTLLRQKLDAAPTEFVIVAINYVGAGNQTPATWLDRVCNSIDSWSSGKTQSTNTQDPDYFRRVVSTTTVGLMRHGIGIMIHYPEANPSFSSDNVNVIPSYSTSVQHTDLVSYTIESTMGSGNITVQDLIQVNNPNLDLYPYFITEQVGRGQASSLDLIQTKKDLISQLFNQSKRNNASSGNQRTNNLYVHDLGGFCVVNASRNGDQRQPSTGWVMGDSYEYDYAMIDPGHWGDPRWRDRGTEVITNYIEARDSYTYLTINGSEPQNASENQTWLNITDQSGSQYGQGGNNALLAEQINGYAANLIYNLVDEGRTPLGVVYMNFAGTDQVSFGGTAYNVDGVNLPSLIMSNNFKFALATSEAGN